MGKKYSSVLVTDGNRVGEVFVYDLSPYDDFTPAAYVVFDDGKSADWLPVIALKRVNATAVTAEAITAA